MGSPVSAILANLVMEYIEEKALLSAPNPPKWWFRYVDDSHVCVKREHVDEFHSHLVQHRQKIQGQGKGGDKTSDNSVFVYKIPATSGGRSA